MCGLVMLITKNVNGFSVQQQDVFASLLYISGGFRGRDGVGVTVIDSLGNVQLAKEACSVDHFLFTEEYSDLNSHAYKKGVAMIGHNRAATRGTISDRNSHPFVIDDKIVLVHNGTFYGDHKKIKDTEVDSEVIGHLLSEHDDPAEALKKVNAAYALMWYNVDKKEIYVIRNSSRTLYFMETATSYIYASEEVFLKFVIDKFNLKAENGPFLLAEHNLNKYTLLDKGGVDVDNADLDCEYPNEYGDWAAYFGRDRSYEPANYFDDILKQVLTHSKDIGTITHGSWTQLADKYKDNKQINIEVVDFVEDNYRGGQDIIVLGKTMDEHKLNAYFKLYNKTLEEAMELLKNPSMTITASKVMWKRVDDMFPVDTRTPMDTWIGVPLVVGFNPTPILTLENNVH